MVEKILVMGVAGCGKSTVASALASALGATVIEGDDHHLPCSRHKMRNGIPLGDADREPWLARLASMISTSGGSTVLSCSALRRRYRDRLRSSVPQLRIVFLDISRDDALLRVATRSAHMFPASLVDSQFETLEPPVGEINVLRVPASKPLASQLAQVIDWLASGPPCNQSMENQP